jgi:hypothetical protein
MRDRAYCPVLKMDTDLGRCVWCKRDCPKGGREGCAEGKLDCRHCRGCDDVSTLNNEWHKERA